MLDNQKRVGEFLNFNKLLMAEAPKVYIPTYLPIQANNKCIAALEIYKRSPEKSCCGKKWEKVPNGKKADGSQRYKTICPECGRRRASWKQPWARLNVEEAIQWINQGGNIGLASRNGEALRLIDVDNNKRLKDIKLKTLSDCSRKRCGFHFFAFSDDSFGNIVTENDGEVRCDDQYVVIAGSYVPTSKEDIQKELEAGHITQEEYDKIVVSPLLGCYTVRDKIPAKYIKKTDLPSFFLDAENITKPKNVKDKKAQERYKQIIGAGNKSAIFSLKVSDIVAITTGERKGHPLHSSDTSANFCIDEYGLGHCWRHLVSLNALQYLAVKSGYADCSSAGTPHKGGESKHKGDYGIIFWAWYQAKKDGLIPVDDKIPSKAIAYIAQKHGLIEEIDIENEKLPSQVYWDAIKIVEDDY